MMSGKLREQVSALVDNELPADEHELLVRRFSLDRCLSICWERYHLIGEAMRKSLPQVDTRGFAERIMKALTEDSTLVKSHDPRLINQLGKTAVGVGLAACVAIIAIIGLRHTSGLHTLSASAHTEIVPKAATMQTSTVNYGQSRNAAWNGNAPEVQARLSNYVINHNEIATAIEQQGMLPYFYVTSAQHTQTYRTAYATQSSRQQVKR